MVVTNQDITVASGLDVRGSLVSGVSTLAIGILSISSLPVSRPIAGVVLVLLTAVFSGHRWSIEISAEGIRLTLYRVWFVPAYRRRYLLDADIELYQSFEAEEPEGLCVREPFPDASREVESECFGPHDQAELDALCRSLCAALDALRARSGVAPRELRHPLLGPFVDKLEIDQAKRDARGRLREVISKKAFDFCGISIPRGSKFVLNDDRFLDPRRDDWLAEVVLGAPTTIVDLTARTGAGLIFDPEGRLRSLRRAFDPDVEIDGNWVDGRDIISFGKDGRLSGFTISRSGRAAGRALPKGSRFSRVPGDPVLPARWICWLGGPFALPEITLEAGDRLNLTDDGRHITGFSPRSDVTIGGVIVKAGIVPIPLTRDGHVDMTKCRKIGLVAGEATSEKEV